MMSEQMTVLKGSDHTMVARQALEELFRTEGGKQGLWGVGGDLWAWQGGRWGLRPRAEVEKAVIEWLEDATINEGSSGDGGTTYSSKATEKLSGRDVREVVWVLERMCQAPVQSVPRWVGVEGMPDPDHCVAFEDVVVDVKGTAEVRRKGGVGVVTLPRDEAFFGSVLRAKWESGRVGCPVWERCQEEWSQGDKGWQEARERMYGYALMGTRKYRKALLEFGMTWSGKGTATNAVLGKLMPLPAYHATTMDQVVDGFGMDGLHQCQVWVVSEMRDMDKGKGSQFSTLFKVVMGGDAAMVNIKHVRQLKGMRFKALPILQSNTMPGMPDDAGGVTSKLVILPFKQSFADPSKADPELPMKLEEELGGIARRWVEAAIRLEMAEGKDKWPAVKGAADLLHQMNMEGNPFDAFLKWGFNLVKGGMPVRGEYVAMKRADFVAETGVELKRKDGKRVPDSQLLWAIEAGNSLGVTRVELANGKSGLVGVGMKGVGR